MSLTRLLFSLRWATWRKSNCLVTWLEITIFFQLVILDKQQQECCCLVDGLVYCCVQWQQFLPSERENQRGRRSGKCKKQVRLPLKRINIKGRLMRESNSLQGCAIVFFINSPANWDLKNSGHRVSLSTVQLQLSSVSSVSFAKRAQMYFWATGTQMRDYFSHALL